MEEALLEDLVSKARTASRMHKTWHFHLLLPGCRFNSDSNKHAVVLEIEGEKQGWVTYLPTRPLELGKLLVTLMYGDSILQDDGQTACPQSDEMRVILGRAEELNKQGKPWEHHLFPPACVFNRHPGKWVNVFECGEEMHESVTHAEPLEDLKCIERLYYSQQH